MPESADDLIGVLLGLVALWFLFGAIIRHERLWERQRDRGQRHTLTGRSQGMRSATR